MDQKSIFYVITNLNRGGAETHLLRVLPDLKRKGYDISVVTIREAGELADEFRNEGIKVISPVIPFPRCSRFGLGLWYVIRAIQLYFCLLFRRPDIVHFFLPEGYLIGGLVSVFAFLPNKVMSRRSLNIYQGKYPSFVGKLECFLHGRMKVILGNSQGVVDQLVTDEGCHPAKIKLIYNGMRKPDLTGYNIRDQFGIASDNVIFTQVANLIPYKGYEDLIHACLKLPKEGRWKVLIVGEDRDGYRQKLENLVSQNNLDEHIIFVGGSQAVADIYKASDIGILASHEEGFSNAILEGMAAALPMVVTNVGGNAEAVVDGETGLVVPAHNSDQLGDALLKLYADASLRKTYGEAGAKRLKDNFSHQVCVDAYDQVYKDILDR